MAKKPNSRNVGATILPLPTHSQTADGGYDEKCTGASQVLVACRPSRPCLLSCWHAAFCVALGSVARCVAIAVASSSATRLTCRRPWCSACRPCARSSPFVATRGERSWQRHRGAQMVGQAGRPATGHALSDFPWRCWPSYAVPWQVASSGVPKSDCLAQAVGLSSGIEEWVFHAATETTHTPGAKLHTLFRPADLAWPACIIHRRAARPRDQRGAIFVREGGLDRHARRQLELESLGPTGSLAASNR
jgi:hypothetical protein